MRAFSAIATMIKATSASPSDTRRPTSDETMKRGHGRELRRAGDQREREDDHDHGRLGQRGDHHLAARADAAEAGADVEPGERQEEARAAEQRDDGDQVGRPGEQRPVRKVGTSAAATQVAAKIR